MNRANLAVLAAIALTSCAHPKPVIFSAAEQCAVQNMVADKIAFSSDHAFAAAGRTTGVAASSGESVSCRRPESVEEKCEVVTAGATAKAKLDGDDMNLVYSSGQRAQALCMGLPPPVDIPPPVKPTNGSAGHFCYDAHTDDGIDVRCSETMDECQDRERHNNSGQVAHFCYAR